MTPPVFVLPTAVLADAGAGARVLVDGPAGRHGASVTRLRVGEPVDLVDGQGLRAQGSVAAVGRDAFEVSVAAVALEPEPSPHVSVVQALVKGDRGELAVELLTEVGVDAIVPWAAQHAVVQWRGDRADRSRQRWVDAAAAAAQQARRARVPLLAPLAGTPEVVELVRAADLAIALHEDGADDLADLDVPSAGRIVIIVGPEGGISPAELDGLVAAGARPARLGPSVLRASSAGAAAASVVMAASGRWSRGRRGPRPGMEG